MDKKNNTLISIIIVVVIALLIFFLFRGKKYSVEFDTTGGSVVETQKVKKNETASRPENPTKEGFTFVDWYLDDEVFDFNTPITKNITLTAKWDGAGEDKEAFVITLDFGDHKDTINVQKGHKIEEPKAPTKEGYKFVKWLVNGKEFDFDTEVTKDITLTAEWEKDDSKPVNGDNSNNNQPSHTGNKVYKYKVSFDQNGGTGLGKDPYEWIVKGKNAVLPKITPKKAGYKFVCWTLNGKAYNFKTPVTRNIKLVAKWEKVNTEPEKPEERTCTYTLKSIDNQPDFWQVVVTCDGKATKVGSVLNKAGNNLGKNGIVDKSKANEIYQAYVDGKKEIIKKAN